MAKKLDKILIADVESTCWEGKTPPEQVSEIIEIGICILDISSGEMSDNAGIIVKPLQSEISAFCTELTTISQALIDKEGIDLAEACKILEKKYASKSRLWASWGDYDRNQFERNCRSRNIVYPFGTSHLNLKTLFAIKHRLSRELGMAEALEMLQLPLDGTHHRGIDDARNIAKIAKTII